MQISEGYGYSPIEEADDDEQEPSMGDGGAPMGNGQMGAEQDQEGGMPMGGGEPPMNGAPDGPDGQIPQGGPDAEGMDAPMGGEGPDMGGDMPPMDDMGGSEGTDDEVLDVDDLTKAQEINNAKVNSVGRDLGTVDRRIEKLLAAIEGMQNTIDSNNAEIESLRAEFEKRNPTQTEKLNLRSLDSYPFNTKPNEYWDSKDNMFYDVYGDNKIPTSKEYTITDDDVNEYDDKDIEDSFDLDDDDIQDIKKIFHM